MTATKAITNGALTGAVLAVVGIVLVFAFSLTFGQRCAEHYDTGTPAWDACVERLTEGSKP